MRNEIFCRNMRSDLLQDLERNGRRRRRRRRRIGWILTPQVPALGMAGRYKIASSGPFLLLRMLNIRAI
jgi:hypothetical protein